MSTAIIDVRFNSKKALPPELVYSMKRSASLNYHIINDLQFAAIWFLPEVTKILNSSNLK